MKIRLLIFLLLLLLYSLRGHSQTCTLAVSITQSETAICSGSTITLTATTSGGTAPFTYVWNTGATSASISVNKAGNYTVTVSDKTAGCSPVKQSIDIAASIAPSAPTAGSATICPNATATLTATAPGGTYQWYDAAGNFLATGATYTTQPVASSQYFYVQTTIGGCTSIRTPVPVYLVGKPTVTGATICAGDVALLQASGGDSYTWYDAATGGNEVSTSADFTTPVLTATKIYYVVAVRGGCVSSPTPVTATVTPPPQPPTVTNTSICTGSSVNLHADAPNGIISWYSVPSGGTPIISSPDYTTPALTATTTYYVENSVNDCVSGRVPITVTVNAHPNPPATQTQSVCYESSAVLVAAQNSSLTYQWYDAAVGGNLLTTGTSYTTPALTNSTTYYVQEVNGGCTSTRAPISVTVKSPVTAPSVAGIIICPGGIATLTATSQNGTYKWYNTASGGTAISSTNSFTTPALNATTTYYVQRTLAGCLSPMASVTVTVLGTTAAPTGTGASICAGSSAVISALSPTNTYGWYTAATGGTLLSTAQVYTTPAINANTTYYVETQNANGCASPRTPVTVTVNPIPAAPKASNVEICTGTSAALTATVATGTPQWYPTATGGIMLATGNTFNTPVLTDNETYYVQNVVGECTGPRTAVTVTVKQLIDPQFSYTKGTQCAQGPNTTPVILNPSGGTFSSSPAGLVFVSNKTGEINVSASQGGIYTISFLGNDLCPHTTSEQFAILASASANFTYSGPYCQDGKDPLPQFLSHGTAGNFTSTPAGLVFTNATTGEVDLFKSKPGSYTVTNTVIPGGGCSISTASAPLVIAERVTVDAGPSQNPQMGTPVQLTGSITGGATTGKWSGGAGSFSNATSLNPVYTPGAGETIATLTLTSDDPAAPCGPRFSTVTIYFIPPPPAPSVLGTTICDGTSTTLAATAPGGTYEWFTSATSTQAVATGPTFTTIWLTQTTTYYVQTTLNGYTSARTPVTVTIRGEPAAPTVAPVQACSGNVVTLTATGTGGSLIGWYDAPTGGNLLQTGSSFVTPLLYANSTYYVQVRTDNCVSPRTAVNVPVIPESNITSASTVSICSNNPLGYLITADIPATKFIWSRAVVAGISNPAVSNQQTAQINESLINTTNAAINVNYNIVPLNGSCSGAAFNLVVTVNPEPVVTSAGQATICNANTDDYQITFNTPLSNYTWSRAAVNGISNLPVSGQNFDVIREVLFNTSNAPIVVPYTIAYQSNTCDGTPFTVNVTVNPSASITSAKTGTICSGTAENYAITSSIASSTFSWSRDAVNGISNAAASDQTSGTINETLINTGTSTLNVAYNITPHAYGCDGTTFKYLVSVNPTAQIPIANSNSPICINSTIQLRTVAVANATYLWNGPDGFTSTLQNPNIDNATAANSGTYTLYIITKGNCSSQGGTVNVSVNAPGIAVAGPNQTVCITASTVALSGSIKGGPATGIWSSLGGGTFVPSSAVLDAQYVPSDADKTAGSVVLTLSSASPDNCAISTSNLTVVFGPIPGVIAGPDQEVCSQETAIKLAGKALTPGTLQWTTLGTGTFTDDTQVDATYMPSAADEKAGHVTLKLNIVNGGPCFVQSDSLIIKFDGPPKLHAGGVVYVLKGNQITLNPVVNESNLTYLWSPNLDINDVNVKNPVITGDISRFYTLTVTDSRGCETTDSTYVTVSPLVKIPNTFTPNGDGINDKWEIQGLSAYIQSTVDIFNRYGQKLYHSVGYAVPWDGTYKGTPLPTGAYYYVIDTKFNNEVLAGNVNIIR